MSLHNFYVYALLDTRKLGKYKYGGFVFTACPFYVGKARKGLKYKKDTARWVE